MLSVRRVLLPIRRVTFRGSDAYWERRYRDGKDSGAGSYGPVAGFKAEALNGFVARHGVESVIEFGCGDGHQLSLAAYPDYVGLDVAPSAIARCRQLFADDRTKRFEVLDDQIPLPSAELALSLDVLYHLVEQPVFERHLRDLFSVATRYVAIFAVDSDEPTTAPHIRHRPFTAWIATNISSWRAMHTVRNPYRGEDSIADLFFFERIPT